MESKNFYIPESECAKIKNISKHLGITMNKFVITHMRKITEKYSKEEGVKKGKCKQIRVRNIAPKLHNEFESLAKKKALTSSKLLELHLSEIFNSYASFMHQPLEEE